MAVESAVYSFTLEKENQGAFLPQGIVDSNLK
jgi:hypothetical protein